MRAVVPPHGGQMRQLAERFGVDARGLLDFSANINPDGPPESVIRALRVALDAEGALASYPDLEEKELRGAMGRHAGVAAEQIAVAHGVIPFMEAVLRSEGVRRCLLPVPSFSEYRSVLERVGVRVGAYRLDDDFRYRREALLDGVREGGYDALLLANPQNPSGVLHGREEMLGLVEKALRAGVKVLLDEAFIDYAPGHSLCGEADRLPNLTVFRSLTKFYGIPGLRVAYAVAEARRVPAIQEEIAAWPVTTLAGVGAMAAVADAAYAERTLARNAVRRETLRVGVESLGVSTYASAANFLLLRLPEGVDALVVWERLIVEHGIVVRECSNFEALPGGHLRCVVRGEAENDRLLGALRSVIG